MSTALLLPDDAYQSLDDLIDQWDQGELTFDEVLKRWPHPDANRDDLLREMLQSVLGLRMRISAIDGL